MRETRQPLGYRRFQRGFTLLELAVVMFLMGLVLTIAMPYFGSMQTSQMRSEARRLATGLCEPAEHQVAGVDDPEHQR